MLNIGVIGYGYWGPNIVRNLQNLSTARSSRSATRAKRACSEPKRAYPGCR